MSTRLLVVDVSCVGRETHNHGGWVDSYRCARQLFLRDQGQEGYGVRRGSTSEFEGHRIVRQRGRRADRGFVQGCLILRGRIIAV